MSMTNWTSWTKILIYAQNLDYIETGFRFPSRGSLNLWVTRIWFSWFFELSLGFLWVASDFFILPTSKFSRIYLLFLQCGDCSIFFELAYTFIRNILSSIQKYFQPIYTQNKKLTIVYEKGDANHEEGCPASPGAVASTSPISSPALNHQGTGSTTTPSSNAAPNTPSDSDERRTRTHRSSTDESHAKTPAVAPVKPAPIKAPAKSTLTTPIKSSSSSSGSEHFIFTAVRIVKINILVFLVSHSTPNNSSPSSGTNLSNHVTTPSTPQVNGALGGFVLFFVWFGLVRFSFIVVKSFN